VHGDKIRLTTSLTTERLVLRPFSATDLVPFAALNAHPLVVASLGRSLTRAESDALVDRLSAELHREGWGSWAVEVKEGARFVGMVGLARVKPTYPFAPAVEVSWRLDPAHWGRGYATEAARACLAFGFASGGLREIVAFTAVTNVRSQAVMARCAMVRDRAGDFAHPGLPEESPLRPHVLFRARADTWVEGGDRREAFVTPGT
jgi:RimJ/RimL family protein N-acetyltransferase